jgi:hypothetical protein
MECVFYKNSFFFDERTFFFDERTFFLDKRFFWRCLNICVEYQILSTSRQKIEL